MLSCFGRRGSYGGILPQHEISSDHAARVHHYANRVPQQKSFTYLDTEHDLDTKAPDQTPIDTLAYRTQKSPILGIQVLGDTKPEQVIFRTALCYTSP
ncbi:hypothetical protein D3C84_544790 [compost metagenome]